MRHCRSDPTAVSGFSGADAPAKLAQGAAGEKVAVAFVPIHKIRAAEAAAQQAGAGPGSAEDANGSESRVEAGRGGEDGGRQNGRDRHGGSHSRDRDSSRELEDRDTHRDGGRRSRSRDRHRDRDEGRGEARSDSRKRDRSREARSDATDSSKRRKGASDAEGEAAQAEPAAVILETSKEGKVADLSTPSGPAIILSNGSGRPHGCPVQSLGSGLATPGGLHRAERVCHPARRCWGGWRSA